jgi:hypothetical protein
MPRVLASLVSLVLLAPACARPTTDSPTPPQAAPAATPTLDPERMASDLKTLADDGWAGRYTKDLEHLGLAADFIADSHRAAGLRPVGAEYRVDFEYPAGKEPGDAFYLWVERGGEAVQLAERDVPPVTFGPRRAVIDTPVWIAANSTEGAKGRAVVTPHDGGDPLARVKALADAGASAVLLVVDSLPDAAAAPEAPIGAAWVTTATAREQLGVPADPPKNGTALDGVRISMARSEKEVLASAPNVLAWIEGSERPDEIVLLGAHYDHIGTKDFGTFCRGPEDDKDPEDTICNGADDNASGTAVLMNIARAMGTSGYQPKRTVVFAHFAGEELGLHGSKALATTPPVAAPFDTGRVVAMLNMDMVGRLGESLEVGGEKTSPAWPALLQEAAPADLALEHPASVTGRSDHAHWYRQGIPVLFFFTGLHDDYHRSSDEFETINLEGMERIGTLILGVALRLADGAEIPAVPKET